MAARSEIEALKAEGARALAAGGEAVRAAEAKSVEQLGREREEAERLRHDLAAAGSEIEALRAEGARALAAGGEQAERLNRDLVAARSEIEALKAEGARALAASGEQAERLRHDLAAARSEIEALKAEGARALAAGGEQAERLNRDLAAAGSEIEALRAEGARALAAGGEQAERLNRDLVAARSEIEALKAEGARALPASGEAVRAAETKGGAAISQDQSRTDQVPQRTTGPGPKTDPASTAGTLSPTTPEQALLARANSLLKDRDISGARLMLERAFRAGSSRAAFQLAETYDPRQLSRWRVHGVEGDWAKAQELYLRALDGGIMEAKDRIAPIR